MKQVAMVGAGVAGAGIVAASAVYHYRYFLPNEAQPTKLFLLDSVFQIAVAALIFLCAATLGARLLRFAPRGDLSRLERALIAFGLGSGALSLATALIGLLHGYYFPILLAELVAPLIFLRRDLLAVIRAILPQHPQSALAELRPRTLFEGAIFTIFMAVAALIAEHTLVPFFGFDVFMYHFALPQRYLALHQLFGSPGLPQANLPYNNEMLNLLALNFRAEIGAVMVQTVFIGGMCLATFALGVRLLSRNAAWLGMTMLLVTPLVLYYSSSGLIDPQFAFMTLLAIIALLEFRAQPTVPWLVLAGLLIGISFGVKYQTVYLVLPMLAPVIWWSRPNRASGAWGDQPLLPWARLLARNFAILGGCAAATFALWAIREWMQVGNPFYPLVFGGAGWTPERMRFYTAQFDNFGSFKHSSVGKLSAIVDWYWHWQRYDYTTLPPLPSVALALGAFALLCFPARSPEARRERARLWLLIWLCAVSLFLWGQVNQLVPRYVLPTFGLLGLLAAFVIERGMQWATRRLSAQGREMALALAGIVALLPGVIFAAEMRTYSDPTPVYTGQQSYSAYLRVTQMWPSYWRAVAYVNSEVPPHAKILGVDLSAGYFFTDPNLSPDMNRDMIVYLNEVAPTDQAKLAWLRAHGFQYVIFDRTVSQWSLQRDPDHLVKPLTPGFAAFLDRQLILVRALDGTDVYLVPPAPGGQ